MIFLDQPLEVGIFVRSVHRSRKFSNHHFFPNETYLLDSSCVGYGNYRSANEKQRNEMSPSCMCSL